MRADLFGTFALSSSSRPADTGKRGPSVERNGQNGHHEVRVLDGSVDELRHEGTECPECGHHIGGDG
jgi:hypothetical protein